MKKVILIADDSPTIRKFVSVALTMQGYEVVSACDGMEAMEKLPQAQFDLVITDLNMPNLDGFELIKSIREDERYKEIPIIILSSLAGSAEIEKGLKSGANSYLVKPFDPKRVQYEVSKYLN
ncbi:MAG: response regulator [Ignavibacteriales bacterium]|nr:response regulator [Ignavibacteriales bacterium]